MSEKGKINLIWDGFDKDEFLSIRSHIFTFFDVLKSMQLLA